MKSIQAQCRLAWKKTPAINKHAWVVGGGWCRGKIAQHRHRRRNNITKQKKLNPTPTNDTTAAALSLGVTCCHSAGSGQQQQQQKKTRDERVARVYLCTVPDPTRAVTVTLSLQGSLPSAIEKLRPSNCSLPLPNTPSPERSQRGVVVDRVRRGQKGCCWWIV